MYKTDCGFTLAEVLIALVIIGIIAAITIPSLITKTKNEETVSKLKKVHSTLAQATNQIISEEGPVTSWNKSVKDIYDLYRKKLITAKECNTKSGCFTQGTIKGLSSYSTNWDSNNSFYKLVLQDGTQISFSSIFDNTCSFSNQNQDGSSDYCYRFYIDVNGAKKPNTFGRDIYQFILKKNGLYPSGCDNNHVFCNKNYTGFACACKVLREGAINY